ncbi:hypothetical protein HanPI659440_Chr05g0204731 [Helianthus annuus]|nr:hypothetical protein HanPI659440_Chr05g0204731 [Helianthus annuus]
MLGICYMEDLINTTIPPKLSFSPLLPSSRPRPPLNTPPFSALDLLIPKLYKCYGSRIRSLGANGRRRTSLSCFYPPLFRIVSSLALC